VNTITSLTNQLGAFSLTSTEKLVVQERGSELDQRAEAVFSAAQNVLNEHGSAVAAQKKTTEELAQAEARANRQRTIIISAAILAMVILFAALNQ
jgi:hypothetical protein